MTDKDKKQEKSLFQAALAGLGAASMTALLMFIEPPPEIDICGKVIPVLTDNELNNSLSERSKKKIVEKAEELFFDNCTNEEK